MADMDIEEIAAQRSTISGHASQLSLYVVTVIFTILACLAIIARVCARTFVAKQAGFDDGLIFVSGVFSIVFCITTYKQTEYGMGKHAWEFPPEDKAFIAAWFWASVWTYYAALGLTKLSIMLQYLRIFPQINFRRSCYGMIVVIVLWTLWTVFSALIMCVPIHAFWTAEDFFNDPRCLPRLEVWYTNAAINIVTDIATALLPIGVINSLDMPKRQKMLLFAVFGVGLITCLISVLRLVYIYPMAVNPDQTWHSPLLCIWSAVEMNVAILCSCAPTLRCLIQRFWPKLLNSFSSTYGSSARRSKREDSAATAVASNGTTTSSSKHSMFKSKDVAEVEAMPVENHEMEEQRNETPPAERLTFRRSLFSPFSGATNSSLASCYGGKAAADEEEALCARVGAPQGREVGFQAQAEPQGITKTMELEVR